MIVLGHRGDRTAAPDNSARALRAALDAGAAGSELDVRRTSDGALVCVHDAVIDVDGVTLRVCDTPVERLGAVTTLHAALTVLAGAIAVVEIKNSPWDECYDATLGVAGAVAEAVSDGTIVACFDPGTLARVRAARPGVRTAVVTAAAFDPRSNLDAALGGGHEICSVDHAAITPDFVDAAHANGREVYAWATDEPERVRALRAMGVDALMCDDPARAIAALRRG